MKSKLDYVPPELQPDVMTDYVTGDIIWDIDYFFDLESVRLQGFVMLVLVIGAVIFKLYNKLEAPTDKPVKREKKAVEATLEAVDNIRLSLIVKLAYIINFFMSFRRKK